MTGTLTSDRYPLASEGPLCELLADPAFLYDVYSLSGLRPAVKAFCKKHRWPGKPAVAVSVGEEQLKVLLKSLFDSPQARERLASLSGSTAKTAAAPLHQAIWGWIMETRGDLAERVKGACHERGEGLLFMTADALGELARTMAAEGVDETVRRDLGRTVLAFAMLQPKEAQELVGTLVEVFPDLAGPCGVTAA